MQDLQAALAAAGPGSGVTAIWVAEGTYVPSTTDATASFELIDGVALYGGFAGTETALDQRDWNAHPTVLSGDIGQDDVVGSGPYWYQNWNINSSNSGHVIVASGTDETAVVDGFTIADGHTGPAGTPAGSPLMFGGGIYCVDGSPTVRNCTFTHCEAAFAAGAGIYLWNSNATVQGCRFLENYCHLSSGGGIYIGGASDPAVEDCLFEYNIVVAASPDAEGGGLACWSTLSTTVSRCAFHANVAKSFYSSGSVVAYGGGLFNFNKSMTVRDCRFVGNTAITGGGVASFGPTKLVNCLFLDNKSIPQPNDPYSELGGDGAAVSLFGQAPALSMLVNCTVSSNDGKQYAIHQSNTGTCWIQNCVVWANTGTNPELNGGYKVQVGGSFSASYSCIQDIFDPPAPGEDPIDPENLPGCTAANPLFSGPSDAHLAPGSPCIDAGYDAWVPDGVEIDLDGEPRFVDDPDAPDVGLGDAPLVDMGCFERQPEPTCGAEDFNCDGSVDGADLGLLLAAWGTGNPTFDLDGNGIVDGADLGMILAAWG